MFVLQDKSFHTQLQEEIYRTAFNILILHSQKSLCINNDFSRKTLSNLIMTLKTKHSVKLIIVINLRVEVSYQFCYLQSSGNITTISLLLQDKCGSVIHHLLFYYQDQLYDNQPMTFLFHSCKSS